MQCSPPPSLTLAPIKSRMETFDYQLTGFSWKTAVEQVSRHKSNYVLESVRARAVVERSGLDVVAVAVVVTTVLPSDVVAPVFAEGKMSSSGTAMMAALLLPCTSVNSSDGG